jgi:hypothetical protein
MGHLDSTPTVTAEVASHVLHHLQPGHAAAREPGSFTTALLNAWDKADASNARKLSTAFPDYAACIGVVNSPGGIETLVILAKNGR